MNETLVIFANVKVKILGDHQYCWNLRSIARIFFYRKQTILICMQMRVTRTNMQEILYHYTSHKSFIGKIKLKVGIIRKSIATGRSRLFQFSFILNVLLSYSDSISDVGRFWWCWFEKSFREIQTSI